MGPVIQIEDLPRTAHAHELVGADYGLPVSLILVQAPPGSGPRRTGIRTPRSS